MSLNVLEKTLETDKWRSVRRNRTSKQKINKNKIGGKNRATQTKVRVRVEMRDIVCVETSIERNAYANCVLQQSRFHAAYNQS